MYYMYLKIILIKNQKDEKKTKISTCWEKLYNLLCSLFINHTWKI